MSAAEEHETFIKTPKQLITVVVLSFVVPVLLIVMLTQLVTGGMKIGDATEDADDVRARIQPVAKVELASAQGDRPLKSGEQVFASVCTACHASNSAVPGSPKVGDKNAWVKLIKEGLPHLTEVAVKGINAMPPKGGNPDLTETEVARAIVHMANQSGANWKEPAAPAADKPAAAQTAAAAPAAAPAPPPPPAAAPAAAAAAPAAGNKGETVYNQVCMACHATGAANAPKMGDKAAWAPRIKQGMDALHANALKGKGAMPPKGGNTALPDADVAAAVDFMVSKSK